MSEFYVKVGDGSTFSKTVGEYDVYGFAGITGDFSPNHTNKASIIGRSSCGSGRGGAVCECGVRRTREPPPSALAGC